MEKQQIIIVEKGNIMIDKKILEYCGFRISGANMFFPLAIEAWYHPTGVWCSYGLKEDTELLNIEEFPEEDVIIDGEDNTLEEFFYIFLNKFGEQVYTHGFENGLDYDVENDPDNLLTEIDPDEVSEDEENE